MTPEAIEELISQWVAEALATQETNRNAGLVVESQSQNGDDKDNVNRGNGNHGNNNGDGNRNRGNDGARRNAPITKAFTFKDFLNCQPCNFSGTEGVVGLARMVPEENDKIDRFIWGLPDNIQGNVTSSKPVRLQDAIRMANGLMNQKVRGYATRSAEQKRNFDNNLIVIRRIGNWLYVFSCEELALIRRISFCGYGVLWVMSFNKAKNHWVKDCFPLHYTIESRKVKTHLLSSKINGEDVDPSSHKSKSKAKIDFPAYYTQKKHNKHS
nr:hypothetical protein [Tanacetum cinerariifolium]